MNTLAARSIVIAAYGNTVCLLAGAGCMTGGSHASQLHSERERRMTVGVVQREIRTGMSPADVATALGSPNIVTRDSEGKETWIYDKIATEASFSTQGDTLLLLAVLPALVLLLSIVLAVVAQRNLGLARQSLRRALDP